MDMDYVITDIANPEVVLREATEWLSQFYKEKKLSDSQYPKKNQFHSPPPSLYL